MGKLSRDKGKRGEREVRHLFLDRGWDAHRTAQVDGSFTSDVVVGEFPQLHVEVKRPKACAALRYMDQAVGDSMTMHRRRRSTINRGLTEAESIPPPTPVVFLREDKGEWYVISPATQYLDLLRAEYDRDTDQCGRV